MSNNILADVGRAGNLPGAVNNLLDRARQMRGDEAAAEQAKFQRGLDIAQEGRAQSAETRAVSAEGRAVVSQGWEGDKALLDQNKSRILLEEAREQQKRDNEITPLDSMKTSYDSPALFDYDYKLAKQMGYVSTTPEGNEYMTGREKRKFREDVMNQSWYREGRNTTGMNFWRSEKDRLSAEIDQIGQAAQQKGKDPNQDPAFVQKAKELGAATNKYMDHFEHDAKKDQLRQTLTSGGKYTQDSVEKYLRGDGQLEPVKDYSEDKTDLGDKVRIKETKTGTVTYERKGEDPTKAKTAGSGYKAGKSLNATDENLLRKAVAQQFGGTYNPITQEFTGLSQETLKQVSAISERGMAIATELHDNDSLQSMSQAANQAMSEYGVSLPENPTKAKGSEPGKSPEPQLFTRHGEPKYSFVTNKGKITSHDGKNWFDASGKPIK